MTHPHQSLSEVHETVVVPAHGRWWRRWLAVAGPALMAAVGYMDPGNWATDIAAGSRYNYTLIWVLLMSNLMAILLQSLAARLGIVGRRDLAQVCREEYPPLVNIPLYLLAEIAITATDLAEVIGSAIALQLLFGLPLLYGVLLTAFDTLLLLVLSRFGIRKLESVVLALVGTIGASFLIEIALGRPDWGGILRGFVPHLPDMTALYIAIGILGATVMPHNLYLHSALVQTRKIGRRPEEVRDAIRWNNIDTAVALNLAFFVNAAIMVMAAAVFYRHGYFQVAEIQDAHRLLAPLLGTAIAPIAFAVALLASGQSSTVTGTLAGQIVMEGYLNLRIRPWLRRLITRILAVAPAVAVILWRGERATGDLLVLSQVVLSLQLPFAIIPLIHAVADRRRMGQFAISRRVQAVAWVVALVILGLNVVLVADQIGQWAAAAGAHAWLVWASLFPLAAAFAALLGYVALHPWLKSRRAPQRERVLVPHRPTPVAAPRLEEGERLVATPYRRVAVALDFSGGDRQLVQAALRAIHPREATLYLLHVVESPAARAWGREAEDLEVALDRQRLERWAEVLHAQGVRAVWRLGTGDPAAALARLVTEVEADLVVVGAHGHAGLSDLVFGTTIGGLRHRIGVDMLVVSLGKEKMNAGRSR